VDDVPAMLKKRLQDRDELVVAVAISRLASLCNRHAPIVAHDFEIDKLVWEHLENAKTDELTLACCGYLWLVDQSTSPSQAELLERISGSPSSKVRAALARALSSRTTGQDSKMFTVLLRLAEDKDELVRGEAISALYVDKSLEYYRTNSEARKVVLRHLAPTETQAVRLAALSCLDRRGQENEDVIIAASKDPDENMRAESAYGLRLIKTPEAIAVLESLVNDPSQNVRRQAATQLEWVRKETSVIR
jgi:hypothetical protein